MHLGASHLELSDQYKRWKSGAKAVLSHSEVQLTARGNALYRSVTLFLGRKKMPVRSDRMSLLGTETAFEVLAEVRKLEAQGKNIISFAIGEPDFDTPEHIKEAGRRAIAENQTHYGPSNGIFPLREAIANYITRTRGINTDPDEVVVTPGA
jgi:DNA-binding transcriptional MocR family regulator